MRMIPEDVVFWVSIGLLSLVLAGVGVCVIWGLL